MRNDTYRMAVSVELCSDGVSVALDNLVKVIGL